MKSLTSAQQAHILSLLDKRISAYKISSSTGIHKSTISRLHSKHCPNLSKSIGGHPAKHFPTNIQFAVHLITSGKADTAVQVTKSLEPVINQSVSVKTIARRLKRAGINAVVKKKKPTLKKKHKQARLEFVLKHKNWTVKDWKKVIWSDKAKINCLGSDGRKYCRLGKKAGEKLGDRLIDGTVKFDGGSVMV